MKEECKLIHEILIKHEKDEQRDRSLLYQEIQHANRRIYQTKADLR